MVSLAWTEGFYVKPRIDQALLREHSRGPDRPVARAWPGRSPAACGTGSMTTRRQYALEMAELFGPDRFYLELQDHGIRDQQIVNQAILTHPSGDRYPHGLHQ